MFDDDDETLLESLPGAVMAVDTEGQIVAGNDGIAVVMGRPREELVGTRLSELVDANVLVDGAIDRFEEAQSDLTDGDADEAAFEVGIRLGGDSPPRSFKVRVSPHEEAGEFAGTVWTLSAVGTRNRYDETVEALHSATRRLMAAETKADAYEICGRAANEILGFAGTGVREFDPETETLRHVSFGGRVDNIDSRPPFDIYSSPHGEAYRSGETVIRTVAENDPYSHDPFSQVMFIPLGKFGTLSVGKVSGEFDQTDIKFAEVLAENTEAALKQIEQREQLREQQRQLERQNERLEEFASFVAHDLRTPLAVARTSFELFREEEDEEFAEKVEYSLDRMEELIEDVLTLAREGKTVDAVTMVDLEASVREAWRNVDTGDVTLSVESGVAFEADRARVLQVFENLFRNTVEHADARTVTVGVLASRDGFFVADDGRGIPATEREAVLESGYSTSTVGTGIGLAIVREIVEAHGWSVSVIESDGGGARFEFTGVMLQGESGA